MKVKNTTFAYFIIGRYQEHFSKNDNAYHDSTGTTGKRKGFY